MRYLLLFILTTALISCNKTKEGRLYDYDELFKVKRYESFKDAFKYKNSAKKIVIYGKGIKKVPWRIDKIYNLQVLELTDNQLNDLPKSIANLSYLQHLILDKNLFENIPAEVFNIKNLKILKLNENKIEDIPNEIGKLNQIESLSLSGNNIHQIPEELFSLEKLRILKLEVVAD